MAAFDKEKGTFSTWAFKCMQNEWWMEARKAKTSSRKGSTVSIDAPVVEDASMCVGDYLQGYCDLESDAAFSVDLSDITSRFSEKQLSIVRLSLLGLTQLEIAAQINLSQAHVSRIKKQIEMIFLKYRQGEDAVMARWKWTKQRKEDAWNYHANGDSAEQIASRLGCDVQQVEALLEKDPPSSSGPVTERCVNNNSLLEARDLCVEAWERCGDDTPPVLAYYLGRIHTILDFSLREADV